MFDPSCDFCRIARGHDEARVVTRSKSVVVFLPLSPAARGHLLVVPTDHAETYMEMTDESARDLASEVRWTARRVDAILRPDGINLIQSNGESATQTVEHVHFHVLPRWEGDAVPDFWPEIEWSERELDEIQEQLRVTGGPTDD